MVVKKSLLNKYNITRIKFQNALRDQIQRLLRRDYEPAVTIQPSRIRNADFGLFTTRPVTKGEALCLYPGVFSSGLPKDAQKASFGESPVIFMGHLFPPSGVLLENENCYILDVTPSFSIIEKVSGYIDALALSVTVTSPYIQSDDIYGASMDDDDDDDDAKQHGSDNNTETTDKNNRTEQRRLDENPAACGHFMNHSPKPNTILHTFTWEDMHPNYRPGLLNDDNNEMYDLPNVARTDGGARYLTFIGSEMTFYPVDEPKFQVKDVCGAVLCADEDIDIGQELFRDYELIPPYPKWAMDWYVPSPDIHGPAPSSKFNVENEDESGDDDDGEKWRLT